MTTMTKCLQIRQSDYFLNYNIRIILKWSFFYNEIRADHIHYWTFICNVLVLSSIILRFFVVHVQMFFKIKEDLFLNKLILKIEKRYPYFGHNSNMWYTYEKEIEHLKKISLIQFLLVNIYFYGKICPKPTPNLNSICKMLNSIMKSYMWWEFLRVRCLQKGKGDYLFLTFRLHLLILNKSIFVEIP